MLFCVMEDETYPTPSWNDLQGFKDFWARRLQDRDVPKQRNTFSRPHADLETCSYRSMMGE